MNSPTNWHCHEDIKLVSDERSSDDVLIAKEQGIAQVLDKLSEVKSWIDDNLRQPKDDDKESEKKFTLSIPCIIKQPKQPEVKGIIKQDFCDRFVVYIPGSGSTVTVSKLFVYPDFSSSVGQIGKCSSKTKSPSKNQRRRGEGSGSIHCKPIKRGNKEYKQYWYHWEIWDSGDRSCKKSKYIPRRLLARVEKLEAQKAPVREILVVLGVKQ